MIEYPFLIIGCKYLGINHKINKGLRYVLNLILNTAGESKKIFDLLPNTFLGT
ncbi:hypothetical protein KCTC32420_02664 [Aequorivita nionensis]